jgi:cell division initiation protein
MLAPHELNKTFQKSVMGYNPSDVDEHISFIIEKYTEVYNSNTELEEKLKTVLAKLDELKAEEDSIRATLIKSQNIGEKIIKDARERADVIQSSIEESCNEIIAKFRSQLNAEKNELLNMRASILEFRKEIFGMYKAHIYELQNLPIGDLEELVVPENSTIINSVYQSSAEKIKKYDEQKNIGASNTKNENELKEDVSENEDILSVLNLSQSNSTSGSAENKG